MRLPQNLDLAQYLLDFLWVYCVQTRGVYVSMKISQALSQGGGGLRNSQLDLVPDT